MKSKRFFSMLLCLLLVAALIPTPAHAAGAVTVESVTFRPFEDAYGGRNDNYVTVVVTFTCPAGMSQLTVLLAGADIATVTPANKHRVIYQNQVNTPEDGVLTFPIEKARIASATGADDPEGATLYLRLSGTGASTASTTVTYAAPTPNYGDLNGDGRVTTVDALMILRYYAGLASLNIYQLEAADVVRNGTVDIGDAVRILRYEARLETTLVVDPS